MAKRTKKTSDAIEILRRRVGDDEELAALIDEERINAEVARMIHDARINAGVSQSELAELVGTSQSTIARLEDADYRGHSLTMLRRIAAALNMQIELRLRPRDAA